MTTHESSYRDDLAYIHDTGFGHLAASAGPMLIAQLQRAGIRSGLVVDLGCGSGIMARQLRDAGYDIIGIDLSESLLEIARRRVPDGTFRVGSFATADIPPCVAVTAIGEVFNYTFDAENCAAARHRAWQRIASALLPGGLLMFDMAAPARAPSASQRNYFEGTDWAILVETEGNASRTLLTRRMTTFRKLWDLYRRDFEVHQLQLVEESEVLASLKAFGFNTETFASYGSQALPEGLVGYLARRP
jgi:SAM-dependent methyltransferase